MRFTDIPMHVNVFLRNVYLQNFPAQCLFTSQHSHNLRKFSQIYAVSMGVVLVMKILCINYFKSLLLSLSQLPSTCRNKDMVISCESTVSSLPD